MRARLARSVGERAPLLKRTERQARRAIAVREGVAVVVRIPSSEVRAHEADELVMGREEELQQPFDKVSLSLGEHDFLLPGVEENLELHHRGFDVAGTCCRMTRRVVFLDPRACVSEVLRVKKRNAWTWTQPSGATIHTTRAWGEAAREMRDERCCSTDIFIL